MLQDTQLQKIFSVITGYYTVHKMGQVCLETQIALAIQFLLIADQEVGDSAGIGTG